MNNFVSIDGAPAQRCWRTSDGLARLARHHEDSADWGGDFRPAEPLPAPPLSTRHSSGNSSRARVPLGKTFARGRNVYQVTGVVPDSPYRSLHEPILPVAYTPFRGIDEKGAFRPIGSSAFLVRTASANPLALASTMRRRCQRRGRISASAKSALKPKSFTTRPCASACWLCWRYSSAPSRWCWRASVSTASLDYSVLARRREIGIRIAIGAQAASIVRGATSDALLTVAVGVLAGIGLGLALVRYRLPVIPGQIQRSRSVGGALGSHFCNRDRRRCSSRHSRRAHRPGSEFAQRVGPGLLDDCLHDRIFEVAVRLPVRVVVWIIITPMSFSFGSTQKWVPYAPSQSKLPFETRRPAAMGSLTTSTLSPQLRPGARPGSVSGTNTEDISSTVLGLSSRLPFHSPPAHSMSANCAYSSAVETRPPAPEK